MHAMALSMYGEAQQFELDSRSALLVQEDRSRVRTAVSVALLRELHVWAAVEVSSHALQATPVVSFRL